MFTFRSIVSAIMVHNCATISSISLKFSLRLPQLFRDCVSNPPVLSLGNPTFGYDTSKTNAESQFQTQEFF